MKHLPPRQPAPRPKLKAIADPTDASNKPGASTATTPRSSPRKWQATTAAATWGKGSNGERRLAAFLEREVGDRVIALHDRLIPGTRGNIDHLFIAPTGVWVVDAKSYKGKVARRDSGPIWRRVIGGVRRRQEPFSATRGVEHQLTAVKAAVRSDETLAKIDIFGALCFVDSEWGLLDSPFSVGNIWVTYPGALRKALRKSGGVTRETMERVARRLDLSLPPAADNH